MNGTIRETIVLTGMSPRLLTDIDRVAALIRKVEDNQKKMERIKQRKKSKRRRVHA